MNAHLLILGLILIFAAGPFSHADSNNCHVFIRTQNSKGNWNKQVIRTKMGSKRECKALARMHMPVFSPEKIQEKRVTYKYLYPRPAQRKQRIPLLRRGGF